MHTHFWQLAHVSLVNSIGLWGWDAPGADRDEKYLVLVACWRPAVVVCWFRMSDPTTCVFIHVALSAKVSERKRGELRHCQTQLLQGRHSHFLFRAVLGGRE